MGVKDCAVSRAAYATVHEEGRVAKVLAAEIGLSHQTLLNKVSLTNGSHFLRLTEAVALMKAAKDVRILEAVAAEMGGQYLPALDAEEGVDAALMSDLAMMTAQFGELVREVAADLADGVVSDNELKSIESEATRLKRALDILLRDLRKSNLKSKQKD